MKWGSQRDGTLPTGFVLRELSDAERYRRTAIAASLTAISAFFGAKAIPHYLESSPLLWMLYAVYLGLCMVYTYKCWTTRHIRDLAPEVKAAAKAQELKEQLEREEAAGKWYSRYPLAALMTGGGMYLILERESLWWVGGILCLIALLLAWEVLLIGLVIGVFYFIFQGIAALPLSVAVVVGAVIIATSVKR